MSFYGVNPEHAGAAMVTIENARNVRMFGAKSEGRRAPTLVVRNSRNILVSAWMGNPKSGDVEYVRVENSSDIEFAGMARPGPESDPMLIEQFNGSLLTIGSNEYLALYRRGMVDLGAWSSYMVDDSGDGVQNRAPVVDAGENQVVTLSEELILSGDVIDDGLPYDNVTLNWNVDSGPGVVYFISPNTVQTKATFSEIGTYALQLSADDGELSSSDIVLDINIHT